MASLKSFDKLPAAAPTSFVSPLLIVILVWSLSTLFITGASLFGNINWMTPRLEAKLSAMMNRNVTLGQIRWHIGLDRLSIITDRLRITELDGKPFMGTGPSEIGIEPNAFLRGDISMTYLSFKNPHMWAVQVAPNKWNFSDLIWVVENVSAVRIRGGRLHLVQQTAFGPSGGRAVPAPLGLRIAHGWVTKWRRLHAVQDVDDVYVDLIRPRRNRDWPVTISFSIPGKGYTTHVSAQATGHGLLEDWQDNHYRFEASVKQASTTDFQTLPPLLSKVRGLFNLHAYGEGTFKKKIEAMVDATATDITIQTEQRGTFHLSRPSINGELIINPQRIGLSRMNLRAGELSAACSGSLTDWTSSKPNYNLHLASQIADVESLARLLPARLTPSGFYKKHKTGENLTLAQLLYPSTISGSANVNVDLFTEHGQPKFTGAIDASAISVNNPELRGRQRISLLSLLSEGPARIIANITAIAGRGETTDTEISFGRSAIHTISVTQAASGCSTLDFLAQNLNLSSVSQQVAKSDSATEMLNKYVAVPYTGALNFSGGLDVNGKIQYCKGSQQVTTVAQLNNVAVALTDDSLAIHRLNGQVRTSGNTVHLDQLSGLLGRGSFFVSGSQTLSPVVYNLRFRSQHLDLGQANRLLQLLRIKQPLLSLLQGQAGSVDMTISGTPAEPTITLTAVPEGAIYPLPGTGSAMKVNSGLVQSNGNQISFRNVAGFLGSGAFRLNGTVRLRPAQQYDVTISAANANIDDTKDLLDVLGISVPLLNGISGVVRDAHFRISGSPANPQITMVAHPQNIIAQLPNDSSKAVNIRSGEVRLDSKNIYYQSAEGSYDKTRFVLNGTVGITLNGKYNLKIASSQADLRDTGELLEGYGLSIPLFNKVPLSGSVHSAFVTIYGNPNAPTTSVRAIPSNVYLATRPESDALHFTAGSITYSNDQLGLRSLRIQNRHSEALLDLSLAHVSSTPSVKFFRISTPRLYLSDLNGLLTAIRSTDLCGNDFLSKYDISSLEGIIKGNFLVNFQEARDLTFQGALALKNVSANFNFASTTHRLCDLNGTLISSGNSYDRLRLSGALDAAKFSIAGRNACNRLRCPWQLQLSGNIAANDFLDLLPFTTSIAAEQIIHCQPVLARANVLLDPQLPGSLTIHDGTFTLGGHPIRGTGKIVWAESSKGVQEPTANLTFTASNSIPALEIARLLYPNASCDELTGTLGGKLTVSGPLSKLKKSGYLDLCNISLPLMAITSANGRLTPESLSVSLVSPMSLRSEVRLSSVSFTGQKLTDVTGEITLHKSPIAGGPTSLSLEQLRALVPGGLINANGSIQFSGTSTYDLDITAGGINASVVASRMLGQTRVSNGGRYTQWQVCGRGSPRIQLVQSFKADQYGAVRKARLIGLAPLHDLSLSGNCRPSSPAAAPALPAKSDIGPGPGPTEESNPGCSWATVCPQAVRLERTFERLRHAVQQQAADIRRQHTAATGALR